MTEKSKKVNQFYTLGEEIVNSISHGAGIALAAAGMAILIVFAASGGDPWRITSSIIFGVTMLLLYTFSTLYHSFQQPRVKKVFRVFDHCSIYLLIAGTYTPFTLVTLREQTPTFGWILLIVVWTAAIVGVTLSAVNLEKFKKVAMVCYVAMGWVIVFAMKPLIAAMEPTGIWLLLAGGISYTAGIIFYTSKHRYMHGVWHFFVLAGTVLHYFSILFYVVK